ncbi:MAG: polyprenyl diphosphate synthase, partial [Alphaproteobacteria bacterium]
RVRVIGDRKPLPQDIVDLIHGAEERTRNNQALDLIVALNYGARGEIVDAARRLADDVVAGRVALSEIDEDAFAGYLSTAGIPDPDLLIRTSGEQRLSNFLLWQMAYAELVFIDVLWPDFDRDHFDAAMLEYGRRERRYGASVG